MYNTMSFNLLIKNVVHCTNINSEMRFNYRGRIKNSIVIKRDVQYKDVFCALLRYSQRNVTRLMGMRCAWWDDISIR